MYLGCQLIRLAEIAQTTLTSSAMFVDCSPQRTCEGMLLNTSRRCTRHILTALCVTKINLGHLIQFVAPACAISLTGTMVSVLLASNLEYQWCGVNKVITPMTAISVRAILKA